MIVKIINDSKNPLPSYGTPKSAGADVHAKLPMGITIHPGHSVVVPTGLFPAIPAGYEIQVRPRSGLAAKFGVTVLNTPGTIDADYRGEIGVILINHGKAPFRIEPGDRIGQLVLAKFEVIEWKIVDDLDETDRDGGFGSTGISAGIPPVTEPKEACDTAKELEICKPEPEVEEPKEKPAEKKPVTKKPAARKPAAKKAPVKKAAAK